MAPLFAAEDCPPQSESDCEFEESQGADVPRGGGTGRIQNARGLDIGAIWRRLFGGNGGLTTTYTYDPVGNRTKRTCVAVDTTYTYDRADHILNTQVAGAAPTSL